MLTFFSNQFKFLSCVFSKISFVECLIFNENDDVMHLNEVKNNPFMIFDDVACERQNNIRNYFAMGRHNKVDTFYLCQSYCHITKTINT